MCGRAACGCGRRAASWCLNRGKAFLRIANVLSCLEEEKGGKIDSHLLHEAFLGGHFKSVFETKYLEPVLKNRSLEILEFRGHTEAQRKILEKLREAARLQEEENTEFQTRNVFSEIWLLLLKEMEAMEYERPSRASGPSGASADNAGLYSAEL